MLLVAVGSMVPMCLAVAERAADHGIEVTVVDPRWVVPVSEELVALASGFRLVVTVEDGGRAGGVGTTLTQALQDRECDVPVRAVGLPQQFFDHGSRGQVLADVGLTEQDIARRIAEWTAVAHRAGRDGVAEPVEEHRGRRVIAEIQVAPSPPGTADDPHAHVEAAIAVIQASGLRYEVGALGTTLEGEADAVWATLRAAHEAMLAAGATGRALAHQGRLGEPHDGQPHRQVPA